MRLLLSALLALFALAGCTQTSIGWADLAPGQEIVLDVENASSTLHVTNGGPGNLLVTSDAQGSDLDATRDLAPGSLDVALRGMTRVTLSNRGEQSSSLRLVIPDPASFTLNMRPIEKP